MALPPNLPPVQLPMAPPMPPAAPQPTPPAPPQPGSQAALKFAGSKKDSFQRSAQPTFMGNTVSPPEFDLGPRHPLSTQSALRWLEAEGYSEPDSPPALSASIADDASQAEDASGVDDASEANDIPPAGPDVPQFGCRKKTES